MKCGICGKSTMQGYNTEAQVPIYDASALARHKRTDHPTEYQAADKQRRDAREAREAREARVTSAVQAAAAQAAGLVLYKWFDSAPYKIESTALSSYEFATCRIAEPNFYARYLTFMSDAAAMLEQAYQQGRPITEADVERVRQAVEAARQKVEEKTA